MIKLIVIVGPTGTGKTDLGIYLAKKFSGEIVSADSRQVFREMNIGTAKPSPDSFQGIPHHLFDLVNVSQPWNAALFAAEADKAIQEIVARGKIPFIVGGTGLHVKALLYGLFQGPAASEKIRSRLESEMEAKGSHALYDQLQKIDPLAANRIHPNDPIRIIRALEVLELTGKPISTHQEEHGFAQPRYAHLKIGLKMDRDKLRERIEARVDDMIKQGLEEEVRGLINKWGELPLIRRAIGYKEWLPYFNKEMSHELAIEKIKIATRQFAKRQEAWFKHEKDVVWFDAEDRVGIENRITLFLERP